MTLLVVDGVVYIISRKTWERESTHFTINVNNIDFNKYKEENFHLQTNIYLYFCLYDIVNVNTHSSHKLFSKHNRFLLRGIPSRHITQTQKWIKCNFISWVLCCCYYYYKNACYWYWLHYYEDVFHLSSKVYTKNLILIQ